MSWLRQQSIASFKALNPDWEVVTIGGDWPPGDGWRFDVLRSDYARYADLYENGGLYFDTDIIFVKPVPEKWTEAPLVAPIDSTGKIAHIACLGGTPGHPFWKMVAARCKLRYQSGVPLDIQAFGTKLLWHTYIHKDMKSIPVEAFLTHPWDKLELLWSSKPLHIKDWHVGVHWYGGDPLSKDMEKLFWPGNIPECAVATALDVTRTDRVAV
ncbi:MAG: glycosyltransferase [Acidimicrobiia bacterium]|nr:glycosyltransferase [Acidimicrobiia bacterium]